MRTFLITVLLSWFVAVGAQAQEKNVTAPEFEFEFPQSSQLDAFFQGYEKDLRDEMNGEFSKAKAEGEIYNPWSLAANGKVTYQGKFWSVMISGYDYRGGAHGMPVLDVVYFDPETFEQIAQADLLVEGAYETLSQLSREGLVSQGFETEDEWMIEGTQPSEENFPLLIPSDEGVEILFNSYQVAPYAAGTPSVKLSWDVANELFKESYRP